MGKNNQLRFDNEIIYCGIDVHKTNWKINAWMNNIEISKFSQNPDVFLLKKYFEKNYPGAHLKVVYEAGFCGFGIQRSFTDLGINCQVVNASDIPATDKDRKRKNDKRDARKLSIELANNNLKGIYVPNELMEHARALVRKRHHLVRDQSRAMNRIKHLLLCHGLADSIIGERITEKYIKQLQMLECGSIVLKQTLHFTIEQYRQLRIIVKDITLSIRKLSQQEPFLKLQQQLQTIDGIGLISGMVIQTEIMDMYRFKTFDSLCDYTGLVPDIYSSNDRMIVRGISNRGNKFLKDTIIECSWALLRKDPAMLMKYNEYKKRMNGNKAIIRIAKHLLARVRHIWKNNEAYCNGIIEPSNNAFLRH
ncbi:IS110 family transposase [Chitinophaga sp. LS1]|uniref:IS110 family transposase n=1 Tax=Chitinophaga sp. LS1 TaxID=3051176 RepID=UPI002AAC1B59|nr:IS110 family transposase [Chitinophaga sp. LS1]WPV67818.1 IS110 family transposase [Chitinophaga sp. LS1]